MSLSEKAGRDSGGSGKVQSEHLEVVTLHMITSANLFTGIDASTMNTLLGT